MLDLWAGLCRAHVAVMAAALLVLVGAQQAAEAGEYRVPEGKTVQGNVTTANQDVYVAGKIKGSLTVTEGEVRLCRGSEVTGDVTVYGGKLERDEGAIVGGAVLVLPASEAPAPKAAESTARDTPAPPEPPTPPPPPEPPQPPAAPNIRSGDVVRYGGPIKVEAGEVVQGDVSAFGGPVDIAGEVRGDVAVFGAPVTVSGKVTGDVVVTGGPLDLKDGAQVGGDAVTIGGPLNRGANVTIGGSASSLSGPRLSLPLGAFGPLTPTPRITVHRESWLSKTAEALAAVLAWVTSLLLLGLLSGLVTLVAPRATDTVARKIEEEPVRVAVFGLVGWLLLLPILFVLFLLIVTWILIPLAALAFVLLLLLGCVGACLYGGRRLAHLLNWRITSLALLTVIGLAALHVAGLVSLLPYGGILFGLLVAALLVMGLGGALMTRFGTDPTGTWLGRRLNHHSVHWTPMAPPAPPAPGSPAAKAPEEEHDLDDKTLAALRDLPPDEGDTGQE